MMKLLFLGATGTVTGSCFLLDTGNKRIMIDCGLFQGPKSLRERNYRSFPVSPRSVDCVLLTHAHIDHSGLIPKLVKHGFKGPIFATAPTVELCEVMLPDSGYIQESEVERKNRKNRRAGKPLIEPIYTADDAHKSCSNFKPVGYDEIIEVVPGIKARFVDAGHILGSAMIELWVSQGDAGVKLVFTGDIGNLDRPLVNDPSGIAEADYVVMESTYGSRLHDRAENEINILHNVIWETYHKGGNLIIPAFAVERTQGLLYHLNLLMQQKRMPPMSVYIDSPLAAAATEVFGRHRESFDREASELVDKGRDPINFPGLKITQSVQESMMLNNTSGAIIISASGMCEAGRIRHHLKYNLWRPESTVLFVGFQAEGTLGRQLMDGAKKVRIFGEEIAVQADIRCIESYSSHADQDGLIKWVNSFTAPPREIFVVHGEPEAAQTLARLLRAEWGLNVTIPLWKQTVELVSSTGLEKDALESACVALATKLRGLSAAGMGQARKEELLARLADLTSFIDGK